MSQTQFGDYLRKLRLAQERPDRTYSVRGLAAKIEVASCYVSKVERGDVGPPSEATIKKLAEALGEDPDRMLAKAGKVSTDLKEIIIRRPGLFAPLLRRLKGLSDEQIKALLA
ncbi:MAG: helix-turn-helix transcriptional regulator, partial [Kiritimatiellia bacterium]|nr:helix-turn-helix transcriptional regulator [Kiritimatiellia bacterium]